jgi:hypothetical protein
VLACSSPRPADDGRFERALMSFKDAHALSHRPARRGARSTAA